MQVNDKVIIKDDKDAIIYIIESINNNYAIINGINYRIKRRVNLKELEKATEENIEKESKKTKKYFSSITQTRRKWKKGHLPGIILHIDGDKEYLDKCLELYETLNIHAYGISVKEENIALKIDELITKTMPDIIVITGHDLYNGKGLKDLNNYNNTKNYMEAIRKIREKRSRYDVCIIAGACQSNFEALIASGADFASSPKRINIHTFDPAVIAIKVATTNFLKIVDINDVYRYIENGKEAFGGVETFGKMRLIYE